MANHNVSVFAAQYCCTFLVGRRKKGSEREGKGRYLYAQISRRNGPTVSGVSTRPDSTSWGGMERGRASARSIQCQRWRTGRYVDRTCLPVAQRHDCCGRADRCLGNTDGTTDCACICGGSWSAVGMPEGDGAAEGVQRELGLPPCPPGGVQAACVRDTPRQILLQRSACALQAPFAFAYFGSLWRPANVALERKNDERFQHAHVSRWAPTPGAERRGAIATCMHLIGFDCHAS